MSIMSIFQNMQSEANAANEERYQDILGLLGDTQNRVYGTYDNIAELLEGLGESARANIGQREEQGKAQSYQSLMNRGLGTSTIKDAMERRIGEQADTARNQLDESVRGQRAGVLQQLAAAEERMGSFIAQMMEARTDRGPDAGLMSQLLQQQGAARGSRGGGMQNNRPAMSLGQMFNERMFGGQQSMPSGGAGFGAPSYGGGGMGGAQGAVLPGGGGGQQQEPYDPFVGGTVYFGGGQGTVTGGGGDTPPPAAPAQEAPPGGGGGGDGDGFDLSTAPDSIYFPFYQSAYGLTQADLQAAGYNPVAGGYWSRHD